MKKSVIFLFVVSVALIANAQVNKVANPQTLSAEPILDAVEIMPEYPGGDQGLMTFIGNNVKYPVDAQEKGIQGTVILRFVVTKIGTVGKIDILRGVSPSIDAEAKRVVNMLSGWTPGKQKGTNVSVYFTLPIRFKLDNSTPEKSPSALVKEKQVVLLDGNRLPVGFDLGKLKQIDYDIEVRKPETDTIKASLISKYGPDAENGVIILTSKGKKEIPLVDDVVKKNEVLSVVEQMPEYPGGETALMNFLSRNLRYPADAQENRKQGSAVVRFVVNRLGDVEKAEIMRSVCQSIDREALRVVRLLGGWKPGLQKGQPVDVYYTLPINFKLGETTTEDIKWNR